MSRGAIILPSCEMCRRALYPRRKKRAAFRVFIGTADNGPGKALGRVVSFCDEKCWHTYQVIRAVERA